MELYLVQTPYHLMLSVINGCLRKKAIVIMLDFTGTLGWYDNDEVKALFNKRFHYINFAGRSKLRRGIDKNFITSKVLGLGVASYIKKYICPVSLNRLYVFNESSAEVQNIISSFDGARVTYIEDGSAPYNAHEITHMLSRGWQIIRYGFGYDPVKVLGTSRYIDDCLFTRPEIVRQEHKGWPIERLTISEDAREDLARFSALYDTKCLKSKIGTREATLYLMPPMADSQLAAAYQKLWATDKRVILIKKHPLVRVHLSLPQGSIQTESSMPAEVLLLAFPQIKAVYGYPSTTLFFSNYIRPDIAAFCIPSSLHNQQDKFTESMRLCNVDLIQPL